jgi:PST family polysaccharide transporter
VGVFGQVVSWPLGFIQIAKGASRSFIVTQTLFNVGHLSLLAFFFHRYGMLGTGMAYAALYFIYMTVMLVYAKRAIGFRWSVSVIRLVLVIGAFVVSGFFLAVFHSDPISTAAGLILTTVGGWYCARTLVHRLPANHRLIKLLLRIPGISRI